MGSLLNRLRQAQPIKAQSAKPPAQDCLYRETRYPLDGVEIQPLSAETLRLLSGRDQPHAIAPEEWLFLDTETTGQQGGAGTIAFLVGLGRIEEGAFVVRQYLMRDYDEEVFVLTAVAEALEGRGALVSFNGASFDMPLLESRFVMNRLSLRYRLPPHFDLLHIARRVYKLRLGRCSLSQLEEQVFGSPREDDLPGSEVPERYFRYLKTKEAALLDDILLHNAKDIVSMLRLLYTLSGLHEQPLRAQDQRDLFSLGRVMDRRGDRLRAGQCYRAVDERGLRDQAQWRLADLMRRQGEHQAAADTYEQLRASGTGGARVYIALAKIYEHRFKQPARALAIVRQGMVYCLERLDSAGAESPEYQDLLHRAARLIRKTGGKADGLDG